MVYHIPIQLQAMRMAEWFLYSRTKLYWLLIFTVVSKLGALLFNLDGIIV